MKKYIDKLKKFKTEYDQRVQKQSPIKALVGTSKISLAYIKRKLLGSKTHYSSKTDVIGHYSFIIQDSFGPIPQSENLSAKTTITWFVPDFNIGSGGHINIFRFVAELEKLGFQSQILIIPPSQFDTGEDAKSCIVKHFNNLSASVYVNSEDLKPSYFAIATSWPTAYYLKSYRGCIKKLYFVQDFEPYFYSHSSEYFLAEATYTFGFYGITAGEWLAQKLAKEFGMQTLSLSFSYDKHLYSPKPKVNNERQHVFFYARPVTPRRGFELGLLALYKVQEALPDTSFILAGWDLKNYNLPFTHCLDAGCVPLKDLPDLYSQCDVALVLSFTNLSLLPLELMACGCPVVSNQGSNVEWLLNKENSLLVELNVSSIADALIKVLTNESLRISLQNKSLSFSQSTHWTNEAVKLSNYINTI